MQDLYEYDHSRTFDKGSAKYVTTSREISSELTLKAVKVWVTTYPAGKVTGADVCRVWIGKTVNGFITEGAGNGG
jgi:hypothetical protein